MASMMGGDFVEAYVLRNAYKEKLRRMDQAEAAAAQRAPRTPPVPLERRRRLLLAAVVVRAAGEASLAS